MRVGVRVRTAVIAAVLGLAGGASGVAAADKVGLSERIEQCASCHGRTGNAEIAGTPSLAGQPEFFLVNQLVLFREGVRRIEPMRSLVADLTDDEIVSIAQHFAKLAPGRTSEPIDTALAARGAALAGTLRCGSCHMETLAGDEQMPRLAGQRIDYMVAQLKAYRDSTRSGADPLMSNAVAGVGDGDLVALAHYAASR